MTDSPKPEARKEYNYKVDASGRRLLVTAYTENLKVVGVAYVGTPPRTTSRRPSDILFYYPEEFLKLAEAKITDRSRGMIIDEPPFIIINLKRVDAIYAQEMDEVGK